MGRFHTSVGEAQLQILLADIETKVISWLVEIYMSLYTPKELMHMSFFNYQPISVIDLMSGPGELQPSDRFLFGG